LWERSLAKRTYKGKAVHRQLSAVCLCSAETSLVAYPQAVKDAPVGRRGSRTAIAVLLAITAPLLWWASTPQSDLPLGDTGRAIAPVWPQHWSYYTTDPDLKEAVVLTGPTDERKWRFDAVGRQRWWELNLDRGAWLRFEALQGLSHRVPAGAWQPCARSCPAGPSPTEIPDPTTWVPCGPVTIGQLSTHGPGAPTTDPEVVVHAVARVDVECEPDA
jgi:hypothetical protein